jgi:ABC-type dipeptide/oligopeptide/nickel transport system ATPase component
LVVLLDVRNLVTRFHTDEGTIHAVNGISYTLHENPPLEPVEGSHGQHVAACWFDVRVPPQWRAEQSVSPHTSDQIRALE